MKLMKYLTRERALAAALACALAAFASFTGEAASSAVITSAQAVELGGAEGGDEIRLLTNDDGSKEIVHIFKTAGDAKLTVGSNAAISIDSVRMLLLGGGGGGGGNVGGGGGAGGFLELNGLSLTSGEFNLKIGAGGGGGSYKPGTNGGDTSVELNGVTYTAVGGGGGGCWENGNTGMPKGRDGGSGGGGSRNQAGTCGSAGAATQPAPGYGNAGGVATASNSAAGGGGGAGATGASANGANGGAGGAGRESDITGEAAFYVAGGGGSTAGSNVGGAGGSGIGGKGADGTSADRNGQAGVNGTGSGGGGGSGGSYGGSGGNGGTGAVIIRYELGCSQKVIFNGAEIRFGNATASYVGGDLLLTYATGTGALKLPGLADARILAVGGGGAGGTINPASVGTYHGGGGGGGAGGVQEKLLRLDAGLYEIKVGAGGASAAATGVLQVGENGSESFVEYNSAQIIKASGGGGGGAESVGSDGASGGGGSMKYVSARSGSAMQGGAGISGEGNAGAAGKISNVGGGGGGAGGTGTNLLAKATGGMGIECDITGRSVVYAGGGGGGRLSAGDIDNAGGAGGGGTGGTSISKAKSGASGLGGGGGGAGKDGVGGAGGDGVVIVRISAALPGPLVKPTAVTVPYTGNEVVLIEPGDLAYTIEGTARATDAGEYGLKVTLKPGFTWTDGTTTAANFTWYITKAVNAIRNLHIDNYLEGTASYPSCTADFGLDTVIYSYVDEHGATSLERPTTAGNYTLWASIPGTANYAEANAGPFEFTVLDAPDSPVEAFEYVAEITSGYTGSSTLTDFQMLVRISEDEIPGIYEMAGENGSQIRFTDKYGQVLPYEVDEWRPDRDSLVWVKVPEYDPGCKIYLFYGLKPGKALEPVDVTATWSNYAGVWHMSETITTAEAATATSADSTPGNHPGKPYGPSGDLTQMVSTNGVVGNARVNNIGACVGNGNRLETANYTLGSDFTYSGWFKMDVASGYPRLGGNKYGDAKNESAGWSIETHNNSATQLRVRGNGNSITGETAMKIDSMLNWSYLSFVFDGATVTCYQNGVKKGSGTINTVQDNNNPMVIGGPGTISEGTFGGQYDEVRISDAALSADWIRADYEQMAKSNYYSFDTSLEVEGMQFENAWRVEPEIEPLSIDVGVPPTLYQQGIARNGFMATAVFRNIETGVVTTNVFPTAVGSYEAVFTIDATPQQQGLEKRINFEIISNRWVREPSLTPTTWAAGSGTTVTIDFGADVRGDIDATRGDTAYIVYRDCSTGVCVTNEMPTEAGYYEAHFIIEAVTDGDIEYGALEVVREFQITTNSPYTELASEAGRVLLANNSSGSPRINYQAYYFKSPTYTNSVTFWVHEGSTAKSGNMLVGETHTYYTKQYGQKLWYLENVRIGNSMPTTGAGADGLLTTQVYLPWETPINWSASAGRGTAGRAEVAHMLLRNMYDACVYSSCFDDGIGTIYFDAVNGWTTATAADASNYRIVVEIATNCVSSTGRIMEDSDGNPLPPTDENVLEIIDRHPETMIDPDDPEHTITNWIEGVTNTYGHANWQPLPLTVLKRDYPLDWEGEMPFTQLVFDEDSVTNEFQATDAACTNICLGIRNGGTTNNFYRIYIPLNYHGPARFRIRRETFMPGTLTPDSKNLILLDNIIVSYPQMRADLSACGWYDPAKAGKQTLGQENAWNVPFPSCKDEVLARADPVYYTNPGVPDADTSKFVVAAFLNYRWRYLDQVDTKVSPWKKVALNPADNYAAFDPLELPGIPGDVEYYFTLALNAPFYDYVDYSGTGLKLGGFYTEELASVTNRAPTAGEKYDSQGTDWFVRLREGKSDYEAINLEVRKFDEYGEEFGGTNVVEMELIGDHVWRGYFQTMTNTAPGGISYRFVAQNLQTPGERTWNVSTNYWRARNDLVTLPASESVMDSGEEDWASMPCDATTGYLLFQLDDSTRSLTIVHADYQNFNGWNDANVEGAKFVGSSTEDEGKKGVSPKARDCRESFSGWLDMPATNVHWSESFTTSVGQEYGDYKTFPSTTTPNGWTAGQGMWVYGYYKDSETGRALQMEGQGRGYVQFVDAAESPRGLESISFKARLGQFINFDNFTYYDAPDKLTPKNYTFVSQVAFDTAGCTTFSGGASLSLIANYRPKVGCYEARLEQIGAQRDKKDGPITGPHMQGSSYNAAGNSQGDYPRQALSIYRWDAKNGGIKATLLHSVTNRNTFHFARPASRSDSFEPMYISVSNTAGSVVISAGLKREAYMLASDAEGNYSSAVGDKKEKLWWNISVIDASPAKLTSGTYGVLSANCDGRFRRPAVFNGGISMEALGRKDSDYKNGPAAGCRVAKNEECAIQFPTSFTGCHDTIEDGWWVYEIGRTEPYIDDYQYFGFQSVVPSQELNIYTADVGKTDWKLLATTNFSSFGTADRPCVFPLYTTKECSVKIAAAGEVDDVRTDLVIDDIELRQWRGASWTDRDEMVTLIPNWTSEDDYKAHTNFIFTSAWIAGESIRLSAKRTPEGTPAGIRSPLFDGSYGRGVGLGMFSFAYTNAQKNVNLLLQIATNINYDAVNNINNLDPNIWVTVTNFSFTTASAADRASGVKSCFFGLHGAHGVMRLIIDPEVVTSVQAVKDPSLFGEIYITDVFCRDEPTLDSGCWWGWNLRTLGPDATGRDGEKRMYLPDLTDDLAKRGLSLALNNSTSKNVDPSDPETYRQHPPFVQTPTFTSNIVGEVTFRARKYDSLTTSQPAQVTLFGSRTGLENGEWERLTYFIVSNNTFSTYTYKTEPNEAFSAFRLAVTGVEGVRDPQMGNRAPEGYDTPVRVLIDEVLVSEAVRARVAFRNVGAFRSNMTGTAYVPNVPGEEEQPLCNESWGVECEVYAAQLPDEIDFTRTPKVTLYWFDRPIPWGFDVWRTNKLAKSAQLIRASDTNLIYRSSEASSPQSSIPMSTNPGTVVQYGLEVVYYQVGASTPMTNYLSSSDWVNPPWYHPVDMNAGKPNFSAYCILDTVAPHWAWINEVNIFGDYDAWYANIDKDNQFVEIAVPQEADISGWSVNLLAAHDTTGLIITNSLGVFGDGTLSGRKKDNIGMEDNMVFRVLACPDALMSDRLKTSDGTADGEWKITMNTTEFNSAGEISAVYPVGIQLVRGSGIIEHEIVVCGTNMWNDPLLPETLQKSHSPSNTAVFLNKTVPGSNFIYVGDDDGGLTKSRGVFTDRGGTADTWNNTMVLTPGRKNQGQTIDPDHPTPNGSSIIVNCYVDTDLGHIYQTVGDAVDTNGFVQVIIKKGSGKGTNIVYRVDPWYQLDAVNVTTGKLTYAATEITETAKRLYEVTVGKGCSNNVTVRASARIQDSLLEGGLGDDNPYTPAVMDWLGKHKDAYGNDWANPDADEALLADYISYSTKQVITNLTLTQMYVLDMDPTVGNLAVIGGIGAPSPHQMNLPGGAVVTNTRVGVYMMMTNRNEGAEKPAWTPYVMRDLVPGRTSWDYAENGGGWTSMTFKVTGRIENGHTGANVYTDWLPLRWFVFAEDSFYPPDAGAKAGWSYIEVDDPHSAASPAYWSGFRWWPDCNVFYRWGIDMRLLPYTVEILHKESLYE